MNFADVSILFLPDVLIYFHVLFIDFEFIKNIISAPFKANLPSLPESLFIAILHIFEL
jgi:hypothetical protein